MRVAHEHSLNSFSLKRGVIRKTAHTLAQCVACEEGTGSIGSGRREMSSAGGSRVERHGTLAVLALCDGGVDRRVCRPVVFSAPGATKHKQGNHADQEARTRYLPDVPGHFVNTIFLICLRTVAG